MSLRTRLLIAFGAIVLAPIALLAWGLRQEVTRRLAQDYQERVVQTVATVRDDLSRESASVAERLASLGNALINDNRFRAAAVAGLPSERDYLLDYASVAMRLTGLQTLLVLNSEGRILSSGHFRNEHGRIEKDLPQALSMVDGPAMAIARTADGELLTLTRAHTVLIGDQTFTLLGGVVVDDAFLARLVRGRNVSIALDAPGGEITAGAALAPADKTAVGTVLIPVFRPDAGAGAGMVQASLNVRQPLSALNALLSSIDSWFLYTALGTSAVALLLGAWMSTRLTTRLTALAGKTAVLDLDRLDIEFDEGSDEVGTLSRLLGDMAVRLRASTARIREAERRATTGDLARQVNHDIKNGLIPLRNVMRHLAQVQRDAPGTLEQVFAERRQTLDSSIAYLEVLATSYQRLSRPPERQAVDINATIAEVISALAPARGSVDSPAKAGQASFVTQLAASLPSVIGDPVAFRRIIENLIANAVDSLEGQPGRITVATEVIENAVELPTVRVSVADTGRGMSADEAARIFDDFYTTKAQGMGLGLSIVRRLVMDLNGRISVNSDPGSGTTITVDVPASAPARG